jgi:hypothetical protein
MNNFKHSTIRTIRNGTLVGVALSMLASLAPAFASEQVIVGLITKTARW